MAKAWWESKVKSEDIRARCDRCHRLWTIEMILLHGSSIGNQLVCPKCTCPDYQLVWVMTEPLRDRT